MQNIHFGFLPKTHIKQHWFFFICQFLYALAYQKSPPTYKTNWNQWLPWGKRVGLDVGQENFCVFYDIWTCIGFAVMNDLGH